MKKLLNEDGLLLTEMKLTFNGQLLHLQRVLVDTVSGSTNVSRDLAELIGIVADGIIGLDLLQQLKAVINIDELTLQSNS